MLKKTILSVLTLVFLVACSGLALNQPTATPAPTQTTLPSATTAPTTTVPSPTITQTITATATATVTASPVPSATPQVGFEKAQVTELKNGVGGYSIVMTVPNLDVAYDVILGGIKFSCTVNEKYAGKLFCWGLQRPPLDVSLTEAFLSQTTKQVVYQTKVVLSSTTLPTAIPIGYPDTNCPDRGKHVSCESECRIYDGKPCMVATCTDACGLYFSVQTCPADMTVPSPSCSAEQWIQQKALNGIP
jgi:hypothetical protein